MKHFLLVLTFSFFFHTTIAQHVELVTEIEYLQGQSALKGNELYLIKQEHKNGVYSINSPYDIIKIDLLKKEEPPKIVFSGIRFGVNALAFKGNDLYMSLSDGRFNVRAEIAKLDVTSKTPQLISVVKNVNQPDSLTFFGDELYILRNTSENTLISKINIANTTPAIIDVVKLTQDRDHGIVASDGKYLYVALVRSDKIVKVDVTATTPKVTDVLTGINRPGALAIQGSILYIGYTNDTSDKYEIIAKADITAQNITATDINTDTFRAINTIIPHQGNIYVSYYDITKKTFSNGITIDITDNLRGKIAKLNSAVLSTSDVDTKTDTNFKLFPNPSEEFVQILNIENPQSYILFSIDGIEVKRGTVAKNEKIPTQMLSSGLYFLKLENNHILKFIKN